MKSVEARPGNLAEHAERPPVLNPRQAIWRIVDILQESRIPSTRLIIEGIVYLALKDEFQAVGNRIINAFDGAFNDIYGGSDWMLNTHEILYDLRSWGYTKRDTNNGEYSLEPGHEDELQKIRDAAGSGQEDEKALILAMAETCYDTFYRQSRAI
ncbi:hypothetical protein F4X86_04370 [Candidatus Saccharibacteria bacterium]|nr:hypothetical protein [Candidatus Saccharibacteria bacterium]